MFVVRWSEKNSIIRFERRFPYSDSSDWYAARQAMIDFIAGLHPDMNVWAYSVHETPLDWIEMVRRKPHEPA